jgi:hypothetical protein
MAKPKQSVLVNVCSNHNIIVWTDHPERDIKDIAGIEGVTRATIYSGNPIFLSIDPRYSADEIAAEIENLLTAEIPDVFKSEN